MKNIILSLIVIGPFICKAQVEPMDLGVLILDSTKHYYIESDLPKGISVPKIPINEYMQQYFDSLVSDEKYKFDPTDTSVTFEVSGDGSLGKFMLGNKPNGNDTLFVEKLLSLGKWTPVQHPTSRQIYKLKLQSNDQLIFTLVEDAANFKGGKEEMYSFIYDNLIYPENARKRRIEGRVFVQFVVEKDGSLTEVQIVKGIGGGADEEALRLFNAMPPWEPARQRGMVVRQKLIESINFKLD